jgi:uncharacterized protein HemY
MIESANFMQVVDRIESKLDNIRDRIQEVTVMTNVTQARQAANDVEIAALKEHVAELKTAHDRVKGALTLVSIPGFLSFIYAISQFVQK